MREHLLAALREAEVVVSENVGLREENRELILRVNELTVKLRDKE